MPDPPAGKWSSSRCRFGERFRSIQLEGRTYRIRSVETAASSAVIMIAMVAAGNDALEKSFIATLQ
jgi:hypothetical protein